LDSIVCTSARKGDKERTIGTSRVSQKQRSKGWRWISIVEQIMIVKRNDSTFRSVMNAEKNLGVRRARRWAQAKVTRGNKLHERSKNFN
jgi:hypothetical protein